MYEDNRSLAELVRASGEPIIDLGRGTRPAGDYAIGQQSGEQINNVAGNQYNQYLRAIYEQRESFLRDIAASRTRARRLAWFGFVLFVVGFGLFGWMVVRFISRVQELTAETQPTLQDLWGEEVGGVPVGFIGFGLAAFGMFLTIVGIVLHVVATSRQRRTVSQPVVPSGPWMPVPGVGPQVWR